SVCVTNQTRARVGIYGGNWKLNQIVMAFRFHGYGETPEDVKKFNLKLLKGVKVEEDLKPLDLDSVPEPALTNEELKSPKYLRQLISISKKCEFVGRWDLISVKRLQVLLQYSENEVLPVLPMTNHRNAQFLGGDSFTDFHLQWLSQGGRAKLVKDWLTYHAQRNLLEGLKPTGIGNPGTYVAAKWIDGNWYRGFVEGMDDQKEIQVYYLDQGFTEVQAINTLRVLPEELATTRPMSFRAMLADMPINLDKDAGNHGRAQLKFVSEMRKNVVFQCRIEKLIGFGVNLNPGIGKASVFLNETIPKFRSNSDTPRWFHINHLIRMNLRDDTQVVLRKDLPLPEDLKILEKYKIPHGVTIRNRIPPSSHPLHYQIRCMINPSLFYVQIATATDLADASANDSKIQDFYNNGSCHELNSFKIRTSRLLIHRPYVWLEPRLKCWHRVVVCRVDTPPGKCYVFRVDIGDHLLVDEKSMMEIKPEFTHWPNHVIKAHLSHILPPDGGVFWKEDAILACRNIAESSSKFLGVSFRTADTSDECGQKKVSYEMLLVDQSFRSGYSIQARLALMGLGKPDGFATGNYHLAFLCHDGIPAYDQAKMFENVIGKELLEFPAIQNFSVEKEFPILKFSEIVGPSMRESKYLSMQAIFKGSSEVQPVYEQKGKREGDFCYCEGRCRIDCEYLQSKRFRLRASKEPSYRYLKCVGFSSVRTDMVTSIGPLTNMFGQYLASIRISYADGPGVFYIQMANKTKELEGMMTDIGELVKDNPVCDSDCKGSLVAVLVYSEELVPNWHRAYVTKVIDSVCKVLI
ncbi:unnamed protein product, partial [Allacma fusca]